MSQLPAKQQTTDSLTTNLDDAERLAKHLAKSGFFDDAKTASQALVKILAGREMGIPEIAALRGVYVIEGNTQLKGSLVAALIKKHPTYNYRAVETTEERAEIAFLDDGEEIGTASFTIEEARDNDLVKDGSAWDGYAADMLWWRALRRGQRRYMPEITWGATYSEAEMQEIEADAEVIDADDEPQRVEEQSVDYDHELSQIIKRLDECAVEDLEDELNGIAAKIENWPSDPYQRAKSRTLPHATRMHAAQGGEEKREEIREWIKDQVQSLPEGIRKNTKVECIEAMESQFERMGAEDEDKSDEEPESPDNLPFDEDAKLTPETRKQMHAVGKDLYGDEWDDKRAEFVEWATDGRTDSSTEISETEGVKIVTALNEKRDEETEDVLTDG